MRPGEENRLRNDVLALLFLTGQRYHTQNRRCYKAKQELFVFYRPLYNKATLELLVLYQLGYETTRNEAIQELLVLY